MDVRRWYRRHNRRAFLVGSGLFLLSALLWLVNFWVIKFFIFVFLMTEDETEDIAGEASTAVACACLAGLALECGLFGRKLYDRKRYAQSVMLEGVTGRVQEFQARRVIADFYWEDDLWKELLFLAPRCTARAVEILASMVLFSSGLLLRAQEIVDDLGAGVEWRGVTQYVLDGRAVVRLHKMGLVDMRVKDGVGEIRLTPSVLRPRGVIGGL